MKDLSELFLPYNLALIAKEKGFDTACLGKYNTLTKEFEFKGWTNGNSEMMLISVAAPLYQQITDWFIKKNIHIFPMYFHNTKKYLYMVYDENKFSQTSYTTMNEAIENAFKLI